jgi:hypothetical protein
LSFLYKMGTSQFSGSLEGDITSIESLKRHYKLPDSLRGRWRYVYFSLLFSFLSLFHVIFLVVVMFMSRTTITIMK